MQLDKQIISLDEMMQKIKDKVFKDYDLVVAIGRGGILPGYLVSRFLDIGMEIVELKFRDDNHQQIYDEPQVKYKPLNVTYANKRILLVDDVANTGSTLLKAKEVLALDKVTTLVISGKGDISLFGAHDRCILWPWQDSLTVNQNGAWGATAGVRDKSADASW